MTADYQRILDYIWAQSETIPIILGAFVFINGIAYYLKSWKLRRQLAGSLDEFKHNFEDLNKIFVQIHRSTGNDDYDIPKLAASTKDIVIDCAKLFGNLTKSKCNVTIKIFVPNQRSSKKNVKNTSQLLIKTFISSDYAINSDPGLPGGQKIEDDTGALSIVTGQQYFLVNDVFPEKQSRITYFDKFWKPPYHSILEVPIKNYSSRKAELLLGVLVITSDKRNAFSADIAVQTALGLAEGMAGFLKNIHHALTR